MSAVNSVHKQAAKAAVAMLVVKDTDYRLAGLGVSEAAHAQGLELGDLARISELTCYAAGVAEQGEKASNRRWDEYPSEVKALARKLARAARAEIATLF